MADVKKQREREILDEVYAHRNLPEIEPHEAPDFLLRVRPGSERFGVEVTEFYLSESEARLERIEGYIEHLLSGGDIRHKDDRQALKVTRVTISSKEGEVKATDVPAIFREGRRLVDFIGALADIIKKKDGVCDDAPEGLTHLNLIIRDRNRMLSYHPCSTFYPIVCTAELRQAVFASRFREIYFITAFQEGDAFIPLKMILTLAKIYMAVGFLRVSEHKDRFERFDDFMRWFAHYLSTITVSEVRLREEGEEVEVLYGNTGFLITGCGVVLHDYTDFPFPESAVMIPDSGWDDLGACSGMPGYEQSNLFQCGMVFAVRTGAVLENEENQQGA